MIDGFDFMKAGWVNGNPVCKRQRWTCALDCLSRSNTDHRSL